jgi:GntR family transcriptional regulator
MNGDKQPAYLRLRGMIAAMILEGDYRDGDMLPSLRSFAAENGANPLTVAKAYQSFQEEGLIVVRRGIGLFLAEGATDRLRRDQRDDFLAIHWPRIRGIIDRLGLDAETLLAIEPKAVPPRDRKPVAA